jgi:predicted amidophosphoribosyltransferase
MIRDGKLCLDCSTGIENEIAQPSCTRCGATTGPYTGQPDQCGECRARRPRIQSVTRVAAYGGRIAQLLRRYKFNGLESAESILARWMAQRVKESDAFSRLELVTWVPTHWKRRLTHRLYPAERLARLVAHQIGLPHLPLINRIEAGPHQVGLPLEKRKRNVRGVFKMRRGIKLRQPAILIVDDVTTTGATINECAKILQRHNAQDIHAAVVLKVDPHHQSEPRP